MSIIGIFAALVCVLTIIIRIPVPVTTGYINIGDFGVMLSGLYFGPIIGGLAGGIGSSIADIIGFPQFAIPTLIIKGLEGFIVGLISNPKKKVLKIDYRDVIAVIIGGFIMVTGYFLVELPIYGLGDALFELPGNLFQFGFGVIGSLILIAATRKILTVNLPQVFDKIFISIDNEELVSEHT
ncbi:MAG: ECF transporter S component [Promethearchaeota archaeon]|nr:MAG: ECF transporter S component [Candidatus Lokiarchaeota archaeon]